MSDITEAIILELDRAIAEGKGAIVDSEISIQELEKELLEKRVSLSISQTVLAALIRRREELSQAPPSPTEAEHKPEELADSAPTSSPKMPAGRVVVNHAPHIERQASALILMMLEEAPGEFTLSQIAKEVYGDDSPKNLKRAQMRLHHLRREMKVSFARPLNSSTKVKRL